MVLAGLLVGCQPQERTETELVGGGPAVGEEVELEQIVLAEITDQVGVDFTYRNGGEAGENTILETLGNGVGFIDFDLDGYLDLFLPGGGRLDGKQVQGHPAALLRNLGGLQFRDVSTLAQTNDDSLYSHGCQVADIDNDGFPDLLVTGLVRSCCITTRGMARFSRFTSRPVW